MIAGHFGFAALVKAREPRTPTWALMLACQWLDVVFVPLFLAGVEPLEAVAGTHGGYGETIIHADYTHSLVGALALAALFGALASLAWGRRAGLVLGGVVFSHWLLDLLMHRQDLPIWPGHGSGPRLGFGLWRSPAASIAVELLLVAVGAALYWRAAVAASRANGRGLTRAHVAGGIAAAAGVATLALNALGF